MPESILIVGAGPTGLTAAVELARRGIVPRIIDRRDGPSPLSRAVGILHPSMELLEPSGVAADIRREAINFTGIAFHRNARRVAAFPLNFDEKTRLYGLPQDRTEHFLARALERYGGTIEYGMEFIGLAQDEDGVTATLGDEARRFDYVIGADGVGSGVRKAVGLDFPGHDLPGRWSIADVDSPGWRDPTMFQGFLLDDGDVCIVAPLEAERFRVIASRPDALKALPVPMLASNIRRSAAFTIGVRQVTEYRVGRVFLAGDAAHCHSPVGGRGMNLGIADAADLARRMVEDDLAGYHARRHAAGQHVLELTERVRKLLLSRNPAVRALVPLAMGALASVPPLGRAAMRAFISR